MTYSSEHGDRNPTFLRTSILFSAALIGILAIVYLFAIFTEIGQVLFTFRWFPSAGVHTGDAVFAIAMAPIWLTLAIRFAHLLHRRTS